MAGSPDRPYSYSRLFGSWFHQRTEQSEERVFSDESTGEETMFTRNMVSAVIILATIVLLPGLAAHAANPADLTSDSRYCPVHYYKAVYDDGPWYLLAIEPIGDSASASLLDWHSKDDTLIQREVILTKQFPSKSPTLESALIADFWNKDGKETSTQSLMLDVSSGHYGLGLIVPFQNNEKPQAGPRVQLGAFTAFLTVVQKSSALSGLSYCKKGARLDLAYGSGTWFFRASKPIGNVIPEIRTKFTATESFIGFGIAYCH